jgi:hypothetical protein
VFLQVGLQPDVPRLLQKLLYVEPDGQMPLSGRIAQSGSVGQHGFTQYCVVPVQLVDPHGMVVVPLDEVVDPELEVVDPELLVVVPELELMPELLVVVPELDDGRPLEDAPLDEEVVCVLLV